jgi:hypothetical protein
MSWDAINKEVSPEKIAEAKRLQANRDQDSIDLVKAYKRLFKTSDGQKVLQDLTQKCIYDNNTAFESPNINYEAAFHNGEAGMVKYIIHQLSRN